MNNNKKIKNVLISISNTSYIIKFLQSLQAKKMNLFATTGTANFLKKSKIQVTEISNFTGLPEIMNGRIKTLHHKIFAGLLYRPEYDSDIIKKFNIIQMDMVIVNFYPFSRTLNNLKLKLHNIIEYIDIGGPAIVRASAKNYKNIAIITHPNLYHSILNELNTNNNTISSITKFDLAIKAFEYTHSYDKKIYQYLLLHKKNKRFIKTLNNTNQQVLPSNFNFEILKKQDLSYGENKHQIAAWYKNNTINNHLQNIAYTKQLQGKTLSYNNLLDIDSAITCIQEFQQSTCIIIKHGTPCGIATSLDNTTAYLAAYATDPTSAFGGTIIFNNILNEQTINTIIKNQFVEIIITPEINKKANKIIRTKPNIRLILFKNTSKTSNHNITIKSIFNGLVIQNQPITTINPNHWKIVSTRKPLEIDTQEAIFAIKVVKHIKSNAIVFTNNNKTLGIGTGQTSRIDAIKNAINKANENKISLLNATIASDAFFPFKDSIDLISKHKVKCIIQPGGSIRDQEVISSVNKYNLIMIFTKIRFFKH